MRWRSGYRSGCSPRERRHAAYLRAKARKQWALDNPGCKPCYTCGVALPQSSPAIDCPACLAAAKDRDKAEAVESERKRKIRLRHGKQVIV